MIRRNILDLSRIACHNLLVSFVNSAQDNQVHPHDILLILASGQFDEELSKHSKAHMPGYTTGHQFEQFITKTDQKFMKWYFEESGFIIDTLDLHKVNIDEGLEQHVAIKMESMIYLSFWESDMTLMILYQLTRLSNGQRYDWFWRDKLSKSVSRNEFFRKQIKKQIKDRHPDLYDFYTSTVISQVRNAIAHSQLAPLNNNIKLLNYSTDPNKYSEICLLDYSEWERLICSTLAFRGSLVSILNDIGKGAIAVLSEGKFTVEVDAGNGPERVAFRL